MQSRRSFEQRTIPGVGERMTKAISEEIERNVNVIRKAFLVDEASSHKKAWRISAPPDECIAWLKQKFREKDGDYSGTYDLNKCTIPALARAYCCEELRDISSGEPHFAIAALFKGERETDFFRAIAMIAIYRDI